MRTIAIAHHKGGTAKTTTTVNLAAALAERGLRVLVIDMDPQGSASSWLGVRDPELSIIDAIRGGSPLAHLVYETTAPGVQLVAASPGLVVSGPDEETDTALGFIRAMEELPPLWDFVLVDCPPSLGYLGIAPLTVCEEVLVPVEAHVLAMAGLSSLMETIARASTRLNPKLKVTGVLACRVNRTSHSRSVVERLASRYPRSFMRTQIRENVRLAEAPSFREPITTYAPESRGAEDYRALAAEIAEPESIAVASLGAHPVRSVRTPVSGSVARNEPAVPVLVPQLEPEPLLPRMWRQIAAWQFRGRGWAAIVSSLMPAGIVILAAIVRVWQINAVGFNTDEAVYSGQAASLANDPSFVPFFPIFRAHPLLFQFALADLFSITGVSDVNARLLAAAVGVLTVYAVYRLGRLLYGRTAGLIAGLLMAVMPYHVIVTRQVLLDGPMTLFSVLALFALAKYAISGERLWLAAAGAALALTVLSKETGIILMGAIFAFFALASSVTVRMRDLLLAVGVFVAIIAAFPLALILAGAGGSSTAQQYLVWQLFRPPNHDLAFYLQTVPSAVGPLLILAAIIGLVLVRQRMDWRERLLLVWIAVTVVFFELWPVKGFQYLLPAAPPAALLAARGMIAIARLHVPLWLSDLLDRLAAAMASRSAGAQVLLVGDGLRERLHPLAARFGSGARIATVTAIVGLSMFATTWTRIQPATSSVLLAGTGGVPGGRESGTWIKENTPVGAQLMTIGPSMANIIQFYGERRAYGLSVSPNPLRRNPSYDALTNPDLQIRTNSVQYVVWDSYSASRSAFFGARLLDYANRYNGRIIHTETLPGQNGGPAEDVIVIYEVGR